MFLSYAISMPSVQEINSHYGKSNIEQVLDTDYIQNIDMSNMAFWDALIRFFGPVFALFENENNQVRAKCLKKGPGSFLLTHPCIRNESFNSPHAT